jgi:transglutaminase-like putative cysteine protease
MTMLSRRRFLQWSLMTPSLLSPLARSVHASSSERRGYELTYQVELPNSGGDTHLWLPLPSTVAHDIQRPFDTRWSGTASVGTIYRDLVHGVPIFYAAWSASGPRRLEVVTRVASWDRKVELRGDRASLERLQEPAIDPGVVLFLKPGPSMPIDGIAREKAREITQGARTPLEKAQAIYQWIVENTFRDLRSKPALVISSSCWRPAIWVASVPISTRCS